MKLNCTEVSASVGGDEYFQVLFEEGEGDERPYLLIQRGFEFEEDERADPCYVETLDENFTGHFENVKGELAQDRFVLRLPLQSEPIELHFSIPTKEFPEIRRVLRVILGDNLAEGGGRPTSI